MNDITLLSKSDLISDIEYLLFVDLEEEMENYSHLKPVVDKIADLFEVHAKSAVEECRRQMTRDIAERLREEVVNIVYKERV